MIFKMSLLFLNYWNGTFKWKSVVIYFQPFLSFGGYPYKRSTMFFKVKKNKNFYIFKFIKPNSIFNFLCFLFFFFIKSFLTHQKICCISYIIDSFRSSFLYIFFYSQQAQVNIYLLCRYIYYLLILNLFRKIILYKLEYIISI